MVVLEMRERVVYGQQVADICGINLVVHVIQIQDPLGLRAVLDNASGMVSISEGLLGLPLNH